MIRYAVAAFNVEDGIMHSRAIVLETPETRVTGSGTINLRDETVSLTLEPHARTQGCSASARQCG